MYPRLTFTGCFTPVGFGILLNHTTFVISDFSPATLQKRFNVGSLMASLLLSIEQARHHINKEIQALLNAFVPAATY